MGEPQSTNARELLADVSLLQDRDRAAGILAATLRAVLDGHSMCPRFRAEG